MPGSIFESGAVYYPTLLGVPIVVVGLFLFGLGLLARWVASRVAARTATV